MQTNELGLFIQPDMQRVVVSSRDIARVFDRNHRDVLRNIRELECSEGFSERNFAPGSYKDAQGQERPEYLITRDGFTFLAMGFTGAKAAAFKEAYIEAFNRMEKLLTETPPDYSEIKTARLMIDGVSAFRDVMPKKMKRLIMQRYYELIGAGSVIVEDENEGSLIERFINEQVVSEDGARLSREDFYSGFRDWCKANGEPAPSRCRAIREVNRLGRFRYGKTGNMRYWEGVNLI